MANDLRLYCYVCGKTLDLIHICLATMKGETDRVFLCCVGECADQIKDEAFIIEIERIGLSTLVQRG